MKRTKYTVVFTSGKTCSMVNPEGLTPQQAKTIAEGQFGTHNVKEIRE